MKLGMLIIASNCKDCGKEKAYVQKNPQANKRRKKEDTCVASGWNSIVRYVKQITKMI